MPKSINLFLIDDVPTGKIKCTLQNWTGVAYKIPRSQLENNKEWKSQISNHLKQTGVYFLLGKDEDNGEPIIYIGQASIRKNGEGIIRRLLEHCKNEKETYYKLWNEAIVLTTQNDVFGATEISYLENKFTNLAKEAGRYKVFNGNEPNQGNITEEKESEMEEFIKLSKMIVGVLGHKVFEAPIETVAKVKEPEIFDSPEFTFVGKFKAKGVITNEGFVVLKGSEISPILQKSCPPGTVKARQQYANKIQNYILATDIPFGSASAAAKFVGGSSLSGNVCWTTKDGKCPKDYGM